MLSHQPGDLVAVPGDRQVLGKPRLGNARKARGVPPARALEKLGQQRALALRGPALRAAPIDVGRQRRDARMVGGERPREIIGEKWGQVSFSICRAVAGQVEKLT